MNSDNENGAIAAALEIDGLALEFCDKEGGGDAVVKLEALNLRVASGECVCLLGRSGVGKTTLLNVIAGFVARKLKGVISIGGKTVYDDERGINLPPAERSIGLALQSGGGLQYERSVFDNLLFAHTSGQLKDKKAAQTDLDRWAELADEFWLCEAEDSFRRLDSSDFRWKDFFSKPVSRLSGGQRQRVALARAFSSNQPRALYCLDEPLSGLDNPLRQRMVRNLRKRVDAAQKACNGDDGKQPGFLIVTHKQAEAFALADRVVFLHRHADNTVVIKSRSEPVDLYTRPENLWVAPFIGDPCMNIWKGAIRNNLLSVGRQQIGLPTVTSDRDVFVGIRGEDIRPSWMLKSDDSDMVWRVQATVVRKRFEGEEYILDVECRDMGQPDELTGSPDMQIQVHRRDGEIIALGSKSEWWWTWQDVHLYDVVTKQRIDLGLTRETVC